MTRELRNIVLTCLAFSVLCGCLACPAGLTVRPEGLIFEKPGTRYSLVGENDFEEKHTLECFGWYPFPTAFPKWAAKRVNGQAGDETYVGDVQVYSDLYLMVWPSLFVPWYFIAPEYHVEYKTFREARR